MTSSFRLCRLLVVLVVGAPFALAAQDATAWSFYGYGPYRPGVPRPDSLLGHGLGTRHTMYHEQQRALDAMIAAAPDRVRTEVTGTTAEGKVMRLVIISSPANIARLDQIRADIASLADPRRTTRSAAAEIAARTPAIALFSHSIHGNEPAGFESAMITAYTLLASESPQVRTILDSTVVIINPSQNPDGHERFAAWSNSLATGASESGALEGSEPWSVAGRTNHYRFDMNRDLVALSQAESRATAGAVRRWHPQVFVDLHSTTDPYFFPPAALPINQNLPAASLTWLEAFGQGNAKAFDANSWPFFVRHEFDLFYAGYWDSWPSLNGATGMTFESDGGPRLATQKSDGTITTFRDGIAHHFVATMATAATLAAHRGPRLNDYYDFFATAMAEPTGRPFRRVVIEPGNDPARTREVIDLLAFEGVEASLLTQPWTAQRANDYLGGSAGKRTFPAGSYLIDIAQPQGRLAAALLEPKSTLDSAFVRQAMDRWERNRRRGEDAPREDYEFYDVTAWALPLVHGLDAAWTDELAPAAARPLAELGAPQVLIDAPGHAQSAYLFGGATKASRRLALQLLDEGFVVNVATEPIRADGASYPAGTFVVRVGRNPERVHARIATMGPEHGVAVRAVQSGFPDIGSAGVGSPTVTAVRAPKVILVGGDGVSQTSYGDVWWYLEKELHQGFLGVEARRLAGMPLERYNVIILPEGSYASALGTAGLTRLRDWVRGGGALITLGSASSLLENKELGLRSVPDEPKDEKRQALEPADTAVSATGVPVPFVSPSARGNSRPEGVPGAIARATLDLSHWLTWGYTRDKLAVPVPGDFLKPSKSGENVVVFDEKDPVLAGFSWPGNTAKFLSGSVWASVESAGRGSVIAFAENPLFRGFWRGTAMLFTNAVMFGSGRP
ncbi:MAG: M14 family zinc carboxypeptidase [Gemmatimonadota bacterium]